MRFHTILGECWSEWVICEIQRTKIHLTGVFSIRVVYPSYIIVISQFYSIISAQIYILVNPLLISSHLIVRFNCARQKTRFTESCDKPLSGPSFPAYLICALIHFPFGKNVSPDRRFQDFVKFFIFFFYILVIFYFFNHFQFLFFFSPLLMHFPRKIE